MSKITGKNLLKLGFKREDDACFDDNFHYYTFEISKKCVLISNSNDEKVKGGYEIELFDVPEIKFANLKRLKKFIKALKQRT